jgi:CheY-like chemotaxis protein
LRSEVTALTSYKEVVALSEQQLQFDIAILDVNLGQTFKNGFDIFEWLRQKNPKYRIN